MEKTLINVSCGQTDLYQKCLDEMGKQLGTPLYYPPYWEIEVETIRMLKELFNTQNDIILMDGSATYGEEASMLSALEEGEKVLAVISGTFGQVLYDIATVVGATPVPVEVELGDGVKPEQIRRKLEEDPEIKMVAVVYVETSQGTINPVPEIAEVMKDYPDVLFMVDAVSALGAMELRLDDWRIDFCCSSPQKCINAPQGTAIVAVSERGWAKIENRSTPIKSLCLDLTVWRRYHERVVGANEAAKTGTIRDVSFAEGRKPKAAHGPSPSYVLIKGLKAALDEIFEEGPENVYRRHQLASKAVREAVRALGLGVNSVRDEVAAPVCTRILWPEEFEVGKLGKLMQSKYGVALGGHRIGNMGFVAKPQYILPTIHALELALNELGLEVPIGQGVAAANRVFATGHDMD